MFELIVMRHGQTDWNIEGQKRVLGRRPIPLNRCGRQQVRAAARHLKTAPLTAVYCSPLVRTMQTAQLVLKHHTIPLIEDEGLAEFDYGEWQDWDLDRVMAAPAWQDYWLRGSTAHVPGGERVVDVQARALAVVERARARHADGTVLCISHADVIKAMMAHYLCVPLDEWQSFKVDNASISIVRFEPDRPRVWRLNGNGY